MDASATCNDSKAETLCHALDRRWPVLWTFIDAPGVESTNPSAERALWPAVLWRKGSFGTQSDSADRFVEGLRTLLATRRQHGPSALDYRTALCAATIQGLSPLPLIPAPTFTHLHPLHPHPVNRHSNFLAGPQCRSAALPL